jgi:hypothetical protein
MNLMDLFVKISVDDDATDKVERISDSLGNKIAKAAKVASTAIAGLSTAAAGLAKSSIGEFADYEQLTGGVETLFKGSADKVKAYANEAYRTAGLSANQYMETVTSFSASLLQGLNGDTAKAADIANKAIVDMSDNANKMGTSMEMIQNAYQGFAKQNYTMLDNLKLGYGGTQEEMARLINDSGVLGKSVKVTAESVKDVPFDKIIEAIHKIQTEMGITGTTAKEASETISGSWASVKATWKNLLTAMADETQDFDKVLGSFVDSANVFFSDNLIPRLEKSMKGIARLVENLSPIIAQALPFVVETVVPLFIKAGADFLIALVRAFADNATSIGKAAADVVVQLANALVALAPKIIMAGVNFADSLIRGILAGLEDINPLLKGIVAGFLTYKATLLLVKAAQTAVTIAQQIMNTVFAASPVGLVAAGLGLVAGGFAMVTKTSDEANDSMKETLDLMNNLTNSATELSNATGYVPETPKYITDFSSFDYSFETYRPDKNAAIEEYQSMLESQSDSLGSFEQPIIINIGQEKLAEIIVDIMRKEIRTL